MLKNIVILLDLDSGKTRKDQIFEFQPERLQMSCMRSEKKIEDI
jgi:hypothetical protein